MADSVATVLRMYHEQCSHGIRPAAVEQRLEAEIGGVPVVGVVDLVDTEGEIIDFKTAAKSPSSVSPDQVFQLATYAALAGRPDASCRIDTLVRTKAPRITQQYHRVTEGDIGHIALVYGLARQAMQEGVFLPNRNSFLCSRRNCGYWRECEAQFGGRVRE